MKPKDGRGLTHVCATAVCQIKGRRKVTYFTHATWHAMKHVLISSKNMTPGPPRFHAISF